MLKSMLNPRFCSTFIVLTLMYMLTTFATAGTPLDVDFGIDPNAPLDGGEPIAGGVNLVYGNMVEARTDVSFPSPNRLGFVFRAFYNSRTLALGTLGYGWTHSYTAKLTRSVEIDSVLYSKVTDETGRGVYFEENETDVYPGAFQERSRLRLEGTTYVWCRLDGSRYGFSSTGTLLWMDDAVGNRLTMAYNSSTGRLETITDLASGRVLTLAYNGNGFLSTVTGPVTAAVPEGVWVTFAYDSDSNLSTVSYADGTGLNYGYGNPANHNITRKRDKVEHHILGEWYYDGSHRCTYHFNPELGSLNIEYVDSNQRRVTDAYGVARTYSLTTVGSRKRVTSMSGSPNPPYTSVNAVQWVYDPLMRLSEIQYAGGTIKRFQNYDARGNPRTVILAAGTPQERTIQFTYHWPMNVPLTRTESSVLGSGNKVTIWDYDDPAAPGDNPTLYNENPTALLYRIIEQGYTKDLTGNTVPYEYVASFTYNGKGQVVSMDGPLPGSSDTVQYTYSSTTFDLQSVTRPIIGATQLLQYDAAGFPGALTDVNSQTQTFVYDGRARPREIHYPDASSRVIHYNVAGFLDWRSDEDSVTTTYTYEATYGRLTRTADMEGNTIDHGYDSQGNVISMSYRDPGGTLTRLKQWSYQHPAYPGLLWKEIQADGNFTEYTYDAQGNITRMTDPNTHTTNYGYDPLNRLTSVTQPWNIVTGYSYDRHGNLTSVTDAESHQTSYTYDDMGRMVSTVSPDTGTTTYVYDAAGNLVSKTDANGVAVTYVYDALNRLTSVNFPAHGEQPAYGINYFYDQRTNGKGHLTDIFDPIQTTVFNYNTRGRLEEKNVTIGANVFTLSQDLTPGGRVSHMEYPDGRTVDFERVGCACRATKVSSTFEGITKVIAEQLTYRPFGENTGMNMGNGGRVNNVVDLDGRMTVANPGSTLERTFAYDPVGHLKSITITGANAPLYLQNLYKRSYDYDALNRLTHAAGPFWKTADFTYDDVGNRLTKNASGQAESYTYLSGSNRLSQITNGTATSYSYDTNGNITGIGARTLVYNQDNRLSQVQEGANVLGQYGYNAFGQRVAKTAGGVTTYYLYDFQGNLMAEADSSGNILSEYLYRGRIRLAMADQATGALYFFHNDQLGTPQLMTDQNNTVVWEGTYEPFGLADINPYSTITNNFRFQGQFYEQETGYHYNYHRYYDPKIGRYLTPDPIGLKGGINPYLYVQNDPINRVDLFGLKEFPDEYVGPLPPDGYYTSEMTETKCGRTPPGPPGADVFINMQQARSSWNPFWFYDQVRNKGPWDYKQKGSKYQDFGNFNYGASGSAFGFPSSILYRAAGWANQKADPTRKNLGSPWGRYPYGDDPEDQEQIRKGIGYCDCMGY